MASDSESDHFDESKTDFDHIGEPPLTSLFNHSRLKESITLKERILFYLYIPFGIILGTIRTFGSLVICMPLLTIFSLIDLEGFFWRTVGAVFNFRSRVTNPEALAPAKDAPILVCNHITDMDGIAFFPILLTKNAIEVVTVYLKPLVDWARRIRWRVICITRETEQDRKHLTTEKIQETFDAPENANRRLFILAEGATTNGRVGLLRYNKFVFSLNRPVQPLALRVNPHLPINVDCPSHNLLPNYFFQMFCPTFTFEYTALPVQHKLEGESSEDFATRVQKITAEHLGLVPTTYSYKDKNKWKKVIR
ncbi:MAG: hypothetical protein EZS28_037069 [Streblomastix strix]|uniref:Phospholipid/glycerol acyltransferase domain-containing protein n=1 Tax=Streblomastix strix TaxID=222440 RepID=A0A5J4UCS9_9EUKA|nr:MAG: hypothetical protein EZS28_037069 [Streblomastix strix]